MPNERQSWSLSLPSSNAGPKSSLDSRALVEDRVRRRSAPLRAQRQTPPLLQRCDAADGLVGLQGRAEAVVQRTAPSGNGVCRPAARPARREASVACGSVGNAAPSGARSAGKCASTKSPAHYPTSPTYWKVWLQTGLQSWRERQSTSPSRDNCCEPKKIPLGLTIRARPCASLLVSNRSPFLWIMRPRGADETKSRLA